MHTHTPTIAIKVSLRNTCAPNAYKTMTPGHMSAVFAGAELPIPCLNPITIIKFIRVAFARAPSRTQKHALQLTLYQL